MQIFYIIIQPFEISIFLKAFFLFISSFPKFPMGDCSTNLFHFHPFFLFLLRRKKSSSDPRARVPEATNQIKYFLTFHPQPWPSQIVHEYLNFLRLLLFSRPNYNFLCSKQRSLFFVLVSHSFDSIDAIEICSFQMNI